MKTLIVFITALLFSATAYAAGLTIDKSATNTDLSAVTGSITIDGSAIGGGGSPTQELFVPAFPGYATQTYLDKYAVCRANAAGMFCQMVFIVPHDYSSITDAVMLVIPRATQSTANWDIMTSYAANGEAHTTHVTENSSSTYNVTNLQLFEIDISGILGSIAAGDYVGIRYSQGTAGHNADVVGVRFKY